MIVNDSTKIKHEVKDEADKKKHPEPVEKTWQGHAVYAMGVVIGGGIAAAALYEIGLLIYEIAHDKLWKPDFDHLEKKVQQKFNSTAVNKFKELTDLDVTRLFKRLALCKKEEEQIINNLFEKYHLTGQQLQEMLMGAHIRVDDGGELFKEWEAKIPADSKKSRLSSHPSNTNQYSISGPLVKELLFSCVHENGKDYTWFQLENHPVSFGHVIRHMVDFFKYKLSNRQQGPDGSSPYTDRNPIIIMSKAGNSR